MDDGDEISVKLASFSSFGTLKRALERSQMASTPLWGAVGSYREVSATLGPVSRDYKVITCDIVTLVAF